MNIKLNTDSKTITLLGTQNLSTLIKELKDLLGNKFDDYTITTKEYNNWRYPYNNWRYPYNNYKINSTSIDLTRYNTIVK